MALSTRSDKGGAVLVVVDSDPVDDEAGSSRAIRSHMFCATWRICSDIWAMLKFYQATDEIRSYVRNDNEIRPVEDSCVGKPHSATGSKDSRAALASASSDWCSAATRWMPTCT